MTWSLDQNENIESNKQNKFYFSEIIPELLKLDDLE